MNALRSTTGQLTTSVRTLVLLTVVLGGAYPLAVTAVGQTVLADRANGSLLATTDGQVVGSALIGQGFLDPAGAPLPQWFQSRPSAAGDGWEASASSGSNLGPENPELVTAIEKRRTAVAQLEGITPGDVPPEAVTASASGLDPHISPEYARLQVPRVARARELPAPEVTALVEATINGRDLGFLGEPTVNVLELNLALQHHVQNGS